jgi:hypothetical protein
MKIGNKIGMWFKVSSCRVMNKYEIMIWRNRRHG